MDPDGQGSTTSDTLDNRREVEALLGYYIFLRDGKIEALNYEVFMKLVNISGLMYRVKSVSSIENL
jgi:hypothetical protein